MIVHAPLVHDDLWTCPGCERRFVSRKLWHACGDFSVEEFLKGKGPRARQLFERFEQLIAAFMARVRFAGITAISEKGMTVHFGLPRPLRSPRVRKIEEPTRGWFVHRIRVSSIDELDHEFLGWRRESYRQMGLQERLA